MQKYRLVMQYKNAQGRFANDEIIVSGEINKANNIIDLGLRHSEQIEVLQKIQDNILNKQSKHLKEDINFCPKCGKKLRMNGVNKCSFNAVFTDHKVPVHRQICGDCKWSSVPSVDSLFGSHMHPDLVKMQCEEASKQSYTKAKETLNRRSCKNRRVNSTMTMHGVIEKVGNYISKNPSQDISTAVASKELIVQVDGAHIKSKEKSSRSFEAMTSVVYKPENIKHKTDPKERGEILEKHCAASSLQDEQEHIQRLTLVAAEKEGLTNDTEITAICDGASNCWSVIDYLKDRCKSITSILDWFHIAMKFKNMGSLKSNDLDKLLDSCKWSLWHGNVKLFYERIDELIKQVTNNKLLKKLSDLKEYIQNNASKIVDYNSRQDNNLIFTSNVAECTVESLINQRCKGKQHMQWSREGAHAILQIRAAANSNDWNLNWQQYVLGAYQKVA